MENNENLQEENDRLTRELASLRTELKIYRLLFYYPFKLAFGFIFGRKMSTTIESLKQDVTDNIEDVKQGRIVAIFKRTVETSPQKIIDLVEGYYLWYFRRRIFIGLLAIIPTVLLFQQNCLITRQTDLLSQQTKLLESQNRMLDHQTDLFGKQNISIGEQTGLFKEQNKSLEKQNTWIEEQTKLLNEQTDAAKLQTLVAQEQGKLFREQNSFLKTQTGLLTRQTDSLSRQTGSLQAQTDLLVTESDDVALERTINDLRNMTTVNFAYIRETADSIERLKPNRRLRHIKTIREIQEQGQTNQYNIEASIQALKDGRYGPDLDAEERLKLETDSVLKNIQNTYLSVLLLVNELEGEHIRLPVLPAAIYKMDLSDIDFTGADLSNISFMGCQFNETITKARKPPKENVPFELPPPKNQP